MDKFKIESYSVPCLHSSWLYILDAANHISLHVVGRFRMVTDH